jgi:hypothetical protein
VFARCRIALVGPWRSQTEAGANRYATRRLSAQPHLRRCAASEGAIGSRASRGPSFGGHRKGRASDRVVTRNRVVRGCGRGRRRRRGGRSRRRWGGARGGGR